MRPIEGTKRRDAISPYGYPGASGVPPVPPMPHEVDWSQTGLVSVFVRDRIGSRPSLGRGTLRAEVHIADPRRERGIRKRLREQIRRNERRGWRVRALGGPVASVDLRRGFERAYAETMARTGAAVRYLYESAYFDRVLDSERTWLLVASIEGGAAGEEEAAGGPAAGAIVVASDGYLHYFLGGTADRALEDSPMKNLFAAMIDLAEEVGMPLNLGGGVRPGDSLDSFKRGFANASAPFHTHELVCDPAAYEELSADAPGGEEFFPAYRAPTKRAAPSEGSS